MTAVITHKTYVAAKCNACHGDTLRICITHDDCLRNSHNEAECESSLRRLAQAHNVITRFKMGEPA